MGGMDGGEKTSNNKVLVGILVVLGLVIVGLGAGIAIVNLNNNAGQDEEVATTEEQKAYYDYVNDFDKVKEKAKELLSQSPVDATALVNLYDPYIEQCLADGAVDRASAYIQERNQNLISAGLKKEALDELTKIDYSVFNEPEQYRYYSMIVELAKELGESGVVAQYEPLMTKTKEAWDRNYAAAERAAAEVRAVKERDGQQGETE